MILVQVLLQHLELGMIFSMSVSVSYRRATITRANQKLQLISKSLSAYNRERKT